MKTRNPLHGLLHSFFTLALASAFASFAFGSAACGAAPGSPGPDGRETTEPSPAAEGTDSGEPAAEGTDSGVLAAEGTDGGDPAALTDEPEPSGAVDPLPPGQRHAPLQAAQAPGH
jgi:hypothetical protein